MGAVRIPGVLKKLGRGVKGAAKGVGKGVKAGAKGVGRGIKAGAKAVGRTVGGMGKSFLRDVAPGDKGWVTRLGQRLVTAPTIVCALPKYSNSRACKAIGKVGWSVAKNMLATSLGLPPGTLDDIEAELNKVGRDRKAREKKANEIARRRGIPAEALMPLVVHSEPPSLWRRVLQSVGLA